jgi:UDP-N-acetylmuramate-alanine ligase
VEVETGQLGLHNIENMVGVGAFVLTRGLVSAAVYARAMGSFLGITRRLDRKSWRTSVPIYEGFGSSYDKARSAIAAMKDKPPRHTPVSMKWPGMPSLIGCRAQRCAGNSVQGHGASLALPALRSVLVLS